MKTLLVTLALLSGCLESLPEAPYVRLVAEESDPLYLEGARAWEPLGFKFGFEESGLDQCSLSWYLDDYSPCEITIGLLRATEPTRSYRDQRVMIIDSRIMDTFGLLRAVAHETGHIILNTSKHTSNGIMAGTSFFMSEDDYALACETIGICL